MSESDKPHFSKAVLDLSERAQRSISHAALGRSVIRAFSGSNSPMYRQLDWQSSDNKRGLFKFTRVPGEPSAGWLPRSWNSAMVMAAETEELEELKGIHHDKHRKPKEAVAYISENVIHIGTQATDGYLFEKLTDEESAIAMRLGRGPLEATMGVWLPHENAFISVVEPRIVEAKMPVANLVHDYPGTLLV